MVLNKCQPQEMACSFKSVLHRFCPYCTKPFLHVLFSVNFGFQGTLNGIKLQHQKCPFRNYSARMNKSCFFVLQYNTEALVLVLQYYFEKQAILKQYQKNLSEQSVWIVMREFMILEFWDAMRPLFQLLRRAPLQNHSPHSTERLTKMLQKD